MHNRHRPYIHNEERLAYIEETFIHGISAASVEIADGKYSTTELEHLMHKDRINAYALDMLSRTYTTPKSELAAEIDSLLRTIGG